MLCGHVIVVIIIINDNNLRFVVMNVHVKTFNSTSEKCILYNYIQIFNIVPAVLIN